MANTSDGLGWLFSVDDHIIETPHLYEERVPRRYRDRAPRLTSTADEEYWVVDGARVDLNGMEAAAGKPYEAFSMKQTRFDDMDPSYYDAAARLPVMDQEGIAVEVLFPGSLTRICGARWLFNQDRDFAYACIRAYNDWILEEWRDVARERFIPAVILPLWSVEESVREVHRTAELGAKALSFSEGLQYLGFPHMDDPYWEPLWETLVETHVTVCTHIGSSARQQFEVSPGKPMGPAVALIAINAMAAAAEFVFSPVFRKHPDLQFVLSEGGIGWVPYLLDRVHHTWTRHRAWAGPMDDTDPVEIFRRNVNVCFIEDEAGIEARHRIGIRNIMWENDYPHTDCNFPTARQRLLEQVKDLNEVEIEAICRANAERVFRHPVPALPEAP